MTGVNTSLYSPLKPLTDVTSNVVFACDLLTTEHRDGVLQATITLATSGIHCS